MSLNKPMCRALVILRAGTLPVIFGITMLNAACARADTISTSPKKNPPLAEAQPHGAKKFHKLGTTIPASTDDSQGGLWHDTPPANIVIANPFPNAGK